MLRHLWSAYGNGSFSGARGLQTGSGLLQSAQPAPAADTIEVFVNDEPVQIAKGASVLQACDAAGIDIPRCGSWRARKCARAAAAAGGRT